MFVSRCYGVLWVLVVALVSGCGGGDTTEGSGSGKSGTPEVDAAKYLLTEEPAGAREVLQARQEVQDGEEVVIVGRIGGEPNPWVQGLAAFNIVDSSLEPCTETGCATPWDYCCEPKLSDFRLLVKVVDDAGKPLPGGAKDLLKLEELQTVVVQGTAKRDEAGNVSLLAKGIYVRP